MNFFKNLIPLLFVLSVILSVPARGNQYCHSLFETNSIESPIDGPSKIAIDVESLAKELGLDANSASLLQDPSVIDYIFFNFFSSSVSRADIATTLAKLAEAPGVSEVDIYNFFSNIVKTAIKDPTTRETVRQKIESLRAQRSEINLQRSEKAGFVGRFITKLREISFTIRRLSQITKIGMSKEIMDQGLFDFYGAMVLKLPESSFRAWDSSIPMSAVNPSQIVNMNPHLWSRIALLSSEIEGGIDSYSKQSGQTFRAMMPQLSRFMGKNADEVRLIELASGKTIPELQKIEQFKDMPVEQIADLIKKSKLKCTSTWCKEENRHEGTLRTIVRQELGVEPSAPNPNFAYHILGFHVGDAMKHLVSRNATEWTANSVYTLLMAHSVGPTFQKINDIRRDETKHIAIFSSAYKYIFGNQAWERIQGMALKIYTEFKYNTQKKSKITDGNPLKGEYRSLFETGLAHLFVEMRVQSYFRSVPLRTLRKLFENLSVEEINRQLETGSEEHENIKRIAISEREKRQQLHYWKPSERAQEIQKQSYEKIHQSLFMNVIRQSLNGFSGAEIPDGPADLRIKSLINEEAKRFSQPSIAKTVLLELLRDYQIMNNSFVRSKGIKTELRSTMEGFVVIP